VHASCKSAIAVPRARDIVGAMMCAHYLAVMHRIAIPNWQERQNDNPGVHDHSCDASDRVSRPADSG